MPYRTVTSGSRLPGYPRERVDTRLESSIHQCPLNCLETIYIGRRRPCEFPHARINERGAVPEMQQELSNSETVALCTYDLL